MFVLALCRRQRSSWASRALVRCVITRATWFDSTDYEYRPEGSAYNEDAPE